MNQKELIELLENKLQQSPGNHEIKEQLAFLLLTQGNLTRAESLLSEVVKANPVSQNALWGLAKINWQRNSYEAAYTYMNLLTSMPNSKLNKEQALTFAKILAKKSKFTDASKWLDVAISEDSSLLQTEMPFLKFIKQNLSQAGSDGRGIKGLEMGIPLPMGPGSGGKHTQYIVVEISHIEPNYIPPSSTEEIEEEQEKEDSNGPKKIVTFENVGGLKRLKQSLIQDLALPLKNPQLCSIYSKSTNPKVLLFGPPGCGKTLISRALAVEAELNFFSIRPTNFMDLTFEECEMRLAHLIHQARESKPSVILIDDCDWLATVPSNLYGDSESHFYRANIMRTLLEALNGLSKNNEQIGLLAVTSSPWLLDHSFLTNTKIDKHFFVGPPSIEDKVEILKLALEARQSTVLLPEKIDCFKVVSSLKNLVSGADIEEVVDSSLSDLLIETVLNLQSGIKDKKLILTTERLIKTGRKTKRVPAVETWMNTAKANLKQKNHPLAHLWELIEESEQSVSNGRTYRNIIRSKLLPPK